MKFENYTNMLTDQSCNIQEVISFSLTTIIKLNNTQILVLFKPNYIYTNNSFTII